jgi:amino acid permease
MFIKKKIEKIAVIINFAFWPAFAFDDFYQQVVVGVLSALIIALFLIAYDLYLNQKDIEYKLETLEWHIDRNNEKQSDEDSLTDNPMDKAKKKIMSMSKDDLLLRYGDP